MHQKSNPTGPYQNRLSLSNKLLRILWQAAQLLLFKPSPTPFHFWRRWLLVAFEARIGHHANAYPGARIWAPWNLVMGPYSCLANGVDCYNVATVTVGENAIVSQYSFLCTATHDYENEDFALISKPIRIEARAWVAAGAFVGPGVTIAEGAVIAARSILLKDIPPWQVWGGSPARFLKNRTIRGTGMPSSTASSA